jgi:hypothetical protein
MQKETLLYLDPLRKTQVIGPIPAGKYMLNLLAYGFKTSPDNLPLAVINGSTNRQAFSIGREGLVYAVIENDSVETNASVGMFQSLEQHVDLARVVLEGQGIRRELLPDNTQSRSFADLYSEHHDFYSEGRLMFFNVPPGKYQLQISADGFITRQLAVEATFGHLIPTFPVIMEYE